MKRKKRTDSGTLQISVNCPSWLQKRMRVNLAKATKDRVTPERTRIAKALLETTKVKHEEAVPKVAAKTDSKKPSINIALHVQPVACPANLKVWQSAKSRFRKLAMHISGSLKGKRFLLPVNHRV